MHWASRPFGEQAAKSTNKPFSVLKNMCYIIFVYSVACTPFAVVSNMLQTMQYRRPYRVPCGVNNRPRSTFSFCLTGLLFQSYSNVEPSLSLWKRTFENNWSSFLQVGVTHPTASEHWTEHDNYMMNLYHYFAKRCMAVLSSTGQLSFLPSVGEEMSTSQCDDALWLWSKCRHGSFQLGMHMVAADKTARSLINLCHTQVPQRWVTHDTLYKCPNTGWSLQ